MNGLLDPDALAAHFGVNRPTSLRWAKTYGWPRTRVGRKSYWTPEQVADIERRHAVTSSGVAPRDGRTARSARRSA